MPGRLRKSGKKTKEIKSATLLKYWAMAIKVRDKKCVYCGAKKDLDAHHIISRRHAALKYDLDNGITLCRYHHGMVGNNYEFDEWLKGYLGERYDELKRKSYQTKKWTLAEKREKLEELKLFIKEQKNEGFGF